MKKLLFLLMLLLPMAASAYDAEINGIFYNLDNKNKTAEVTYQYKNLGNGDNYPDPVTIPQTVTYNGVEYNVTAIGEGAFANCTTLRTINIPSSVTTIGRSAFRNCSNLKSIDIPNSVTSIESYTFAKCSSLQNITIPNSVTSIGSHAFQECSSLQTITIPNSVTSIGYHAFQECSSLQTITIPNSVTSIRYHAFNYCSSLQTITIPNSVTSIEAFTFYGCSSLQDITIPNSIASIGKDAFCGCRDLKSISIPNSVNSIGEYAFYGCSGLEKIICYAKDVPITENNAFDESDFENAILFVPVESLNKYKVTPPWSSFKTIKAIEDATTLISEVSDFKFKINVNGSTINILSEVEGQHISIYSIGGQLIGSTVVNNGSATVNTSLKSGSIAVVKVGKKSVRVAIK